MNKKNIFPNLQKPVDRVSTGQLPSALAELTEETLSGTYVLPSVLEYRFSGGACSYSGDNE
ncbi:MAG: microcyclamide/patellamide family RiPP [Leptolyngbya sp. SIO1D8]|nr:microcyclamide/patellamide family RiPP [Leptolyngbya sp. SIO1D8]